jgi:hypothetical protein
MDMTEHINQYREMARHLWNTSFRATADWDSVERFNEICELLFKELVLARNNLGTSVIPLNTNTEYLSEYQIHVEGNGKLPLIINREIPASGYWDYPIEWIAPEQKNDIRPICIFDFDLLGWKGMEYYRVKILECQSNPEVEGREALIACKYVSVKALDT